MKNTFNTLKAIALFSILFTTIIACDEDFANIESDIQGVKNFEGSSRTFPVLAYTKSVTPFTASGAEDMVGVQTTSLSNNLLGVYKDPNDVFGTTSANIITQVLPDFFDPDFGTQPEVESVKITIPYFSTLTAIESDGSSNYELDSIFGDPDVGYKLSIYENKYLLRDLDPNTGFEEIQLYYSNQDNLFSNQLGQLLYESNTLTPFKPSNEEVLIYDEGEVDERLSPRLQLELFDTVDSNNPVNTFWQELFFSEEGIAAFNSANSFTNHFRGLVLKVEAISPEGGSMIMLNFASSDTSIEVDFTNFEETNAEEGEFISETSFSLNFEGKRINTFSTTEVTSNLNGDATTGSENLHLKGLDGYMSVIDLFGDEETEFREKKGKWLLNEANLIFYVNEALVAGDEPSRVMLFDLKNNVPIVDYFLDGTTNSTSPDESKIQYAEALSDGRYKFRLTNHINNILQRDSTNVKLGLYVSANVNLTQNSQIQDAEVDEDDETQLTLIPTGSVLQPKATILHGNLSSTVDKRPVFEIFYTEPEND
ncbi:DUF4270 domain-containing protein [Lacinutrix sp. 5H-3-7-4]|uniref:DUF4270 domain-containing protein n=1 Tax=Lacinutrix sp. (strain 5H-3-7-4) TaxID=983544 RepID=UPI00020A33C5|nr:DUF4270 domain-containing protein [Lacinutrix sp. 5H-3-7-4]AEH00680.1 hypothetical protein Lacal_0832 [Lacinutrix sp. 5H-3-7-4]